MQRMNINQLAIISNQVINKKLTECNINIISINVGFIIKILDPKNSNKTNIYKYKCLIGKLMYLVYETKLDNAFAIK